MNYFCQSMRKDAMFKVGNDLRITSSVRKDVKESAYSSQRVWQQEMANALEIYLISLYSVYLILRIYPKELIR